MAVLALCGCTAPVRVAGPPPSESQNVPETNRGTTESAELQVDPELTVITIIVRRAGLLARLGHDHVITSDDESGVVWLGADPASSRFEVRLPVEKLEVDLAAARAAAGAEFAAPVPDSAREGTRQNMLRPEVLDGSRYPVILLRSAGASGAWPNSVVRLGVTLKDRETEIDGANASRSGPGSSHGPRFARPAPDRTRLDALQRGRWSDPGGRRAGDPLRDCCIEAARQTTLVGRRFLDHQACRVGRIGVLRCHQQ